MSKAEFTQGVLFDNHPPTKKIIEKTANYTMFEDGSVKVHSQKANTEGGSKKRGKRRYSNFIH